ncbi:MULTISPECIES: hypothetical protein [Flavobacterium]|uniref:hypothetical protein n=1 Tax=Flavobacterium TaxID=237 RepID=UPI001FCAF728|nr:MULTISPECIES: hypothetical protein [Flavobacterium]UOK43760.1 hypothetical protein LZF87_06470 [Flavobacterium enshiense]
MDIIAVLIVITLGLGFVSYFKKELSATELQWLRKLLFYHLLFGAYYCFFVSGDAVGYWRVAQNMTSDDFNKFIVGEKGTYVLFALNYFPAKILGLSYFSGTMIYSLLGFIGLTFFYVLAVKTISYNSKFGNYTLFPLVFFMPNLHFWSSAVGKDTLLFLCIGMFSYGLLNISRRIFLIAIALVLSYIVRPHITLFLLVSFGLSYIMSSKVSGAKRIVLSVILIGIGIAILPSVMEFAKIEETTMESFEQFSEKKADLLSRANSGSRIDISSYPFPLKVFTFLYRPLFFDINGIPAAIASVENLLLLIISFSIFRNKPVQTFKAAPFVVKGLVIFLIIGTLAFSQSLGNLGIMIRMRNMFLPGLLLFILWSFSYRKELEMKKK